MISGTLVRDGRPVRGSVVAFVKRAENELVNLGNAGTARTVGDGSFAFERLTVGDGPPPDGTYVLRGLGEGASALPGGSRRIEHPLPDDVEVDVRGGVGPHDVVVEALQGTALVRGRVLEPSGRPIERVRVYARSEVDGWPIESSHQATAADGTFVLGRLFAGQGELRLDPPADRYKRHTVEFVLEGATRAIDLGDIVLEDAGNRSVTIAIAYTDPDADPDADPELGMIQVSLRALDGSGSRFARVVGGKATFENLDAGLYQPEVVFSVHLRPALEAIDLRDAMHVEVAVAADPGMTIHGEVLLPDSFPRQGTGDDLWIPVRVHYAEGGRVARIARLDGRRYRIQGLREGRVTKLTLIAVAPGIRAAYVDMPGFSIVQQDQEVPLGRVDAPRGDRQDERE